MSVGAAFQVGAVREHLQRNGESVALRRHLERTHIERQIGDLLGFAAGETDLPHLRGAAAAREKENP